MAEKIEVKPGVFVTPNKTTSTKIGLDEAASYTPKGYAEAKKDTGGITYTGTEVIDDQPWLLRVEQGAATLFDNINGIFAGASKALNGVISFIKNYWQFLIIAAVALVVLDSK